MSVSLSKHLSVRMSSRGRAIARDVIEARQRRNDPYTPTVRPRAKVECDACGDAAIRIEHGRRLCGYCE